MPGDDVKLIIQSKPQGLKYDAERMWVRVREVTPSGLCGELNNEAFDMPQLELGHSIRFQAFHIIDIDTDRTLPDELPRKEYWDRCIVDRCVLDDGVPVSFIYREEPDLAQPDDKYPDSGWRVRGDYRDISEEELESRDVTYIALGKVLNVDDSWLDLIDSPIGSAFLRNFETGQYEPEEPDLSNDN